jgi:predicted nucleic acid-binding protein
VNHLVFWDASAFVALGNRRDVLHAPAVTLSKRLAHEQAYVLTTSAVLTEVANSFSKFGARTVARKLIHSVQQSVTLGIANIVHVDETIWQRGWQLYQERTDKEWGLTDCISFVIMQDYGVTEAFTADRHFEQAGFMRLLHP